MNVMDIFLKKHDTTRYHLSKLSGILENTLSAQAKKPLSGIPISTLRALGMLVGLESWEVLEELEQIEKESDPILGFRSLLLKYQCTFPKLELTLYKLIQEANEQNIELKTFTFNRLENDMEKLDDLKDKQAAVKKALENTIVQLSELVEKYKKG